MQWWTFTYITFGPAQVLANTAETQIAIPMSMFTFREYRSPKYPKSGAKIMYEHINRVWISPAIASSIS